MDTMIGHIIDNYKILEVIGRGGMGVVFKAFDMNLEKNVALKMIDPFLARDENFLGRFKTEARALAKLENQNIVNVYALRETELGFFMVMEYVNAKTISEWLRDKGKFQANETKDITKQILNAIGHAHKVGVIHRDIKPNNILLCDDGTVKVMDFGLAKVIQDHASQKTMTHTAAGTLYYMSPEQVKGLKNVDVKSDIYSIGMTLYEMLTGRVPFDKTEPEYAIQKQIVEGQIPSPAKFNPLITNQWLKIILKAIEKDPGKRFQNIPEMQLAVSQIQIEEPASDDKTRVIVSHEGSTLSDDGKNRKKKYAALSAAGILILSFILFLIFNSGNKNNKEPVVNDTDTNKIVISDNGNNKSVYSRLSINTSPPGASVLINDKVMGKTPFYKDSLTTGEYSIGLKLAGFKQTTSSYSLKEGDNSFNISLEPAPEVAQNAFLVLKMVPSGNIFIDNKKVNLSGNESIKSTLTSGRHSVKFVHPQFGTKETAVNLKGNETKELVCYFQQQANIQSLNKYGEPFWGTIYLNNISTDKTTPGNLILNPGTYKITVKKSGYSTREKEIVLTVNPSFEKRTHSLVFHLE